MHYFDYRNGILHAEDVPLDAIARASARLSIATPRRPSSGTITSSPGRSRPATRWSAIRSRRTPTFPSSARWPSSAPARTLFPRAKSTGRWPRAFRRGKSCFPASARPAPRWRFALDAGIFGFNVESEAELRALSEVASSRGATARIAFRINPDVDAKTHAKIATGKAEHKFGIGWREAPALYALAADPARPFGRRRAYAYRQPDHQHRAVQGCVRAAG